MAAQSQLVQVEALITCRDLDLVLPLRPVRM